MIKVYKEKLNVCGNILWEKDFPEEKRQILESSLKIQGFKFVSRFPEGDGITFSFRDSAKGITRIEEEMFYHFFYVVCGLIGEEFETNYFPITPKEVMYN